MNKIYLHHISHTDSSFGACDLLRASYIFTVGNQPNSSFYLVARPHDNCCYLNVYKNYILKSKFSYKKFIREVLESMQQYDFKSR